MYLFSWINYLSKFPVVGQVRCNTSCLCHCFRFLEEQNKKTKSGENGKNTETNDVDMDPGKLNGKASTIASDSLSRKYNKDSDGEVSMNSFLKASPFLSADGEDEEMRIKPQPKFLNQDWHNEDKFSKPKIMAAHSARELFEERFGKWQNLAYSQVANSGLGDLAEDLYLNQKPDKTTAIAVALNKRELAGKFEELSPDMVAKSRKMPPSPALPKKYSDREMFLIRSEDSPFMSSRKQETKINVRMDFLGDSYIG